MLQNQIFYCCFSQNYLQHTTHAYQQNLLSLEKSSCPRSPFHKVCFCCLLVYDYLAPSARIFFTSLLFCAASKKSNQSLILQKSAFYSPWITHLHNTIIHNFVIEKDGTTESNPGSTAFSHVFTFRSIAEAVKVR